MKNTKKMITKIMFLCAIVAGMAMTMPKVSWASTDEFVIRKGVLKEYEGKGGNVTIPENVTKIGEYAFLGCKNLKSVTVPGNVREIDESAFSDCKNLTSVIMNEGVTMIGSYAFEDCKKLNSVTIPKSAKKIGRGAFYKTSWWTRKLKSRKDHLVIINNILVDGTQASGNISISKGVTAIEDDAFFLDSLSNKKLKSVKIPSGVKSVGSFAFAYCVNLKKITFPKSVKSIGEGAVAGCKGLKEITIMNPKARLHWDGSKKSKNMKKNIFDGMEYGLYGKKMIIRGYKNSTAERLAKYMNKKGLWDTGFRRYEKTVFKTMKK